MAKKQFVSSARAVRVRKNGARTPDDPIDFSDIPQSTDGELKRARRVGRPKSGNAKQLIAIRIAPRLLAQLRRLAAKRDKPYQTLIHELLERAARNSKVAESLLSIAVRRENRKAFLGHRFQLGYPLYIVRGVQAPLYAVLPPLQLCCSSAMEYLLPKEMDA